MRTALGMASEGPKGNALESFERKSVFFWGDAAIYKHEASLNLMRTSWSRKAETDESEKAFEDDKIKQKKLKKRN